ncbi:serine/threonine-protein kinase [Umezawaea endophytica]|uniref:Serine/threonine protein kinase n=1 Tax=Umezawaea endophytica TaxID=1654476 RepID=A0A9X3AEC7_9PSEU|nr:serine/threonine-protein kinase [Umezawaea endophytica]MCS7475770.1 serine/threonine protein kinase [Umezawaea endophytica]
MKPLGASDPTTIGRYRILAELGRGGMGRVLLGSGPDGRLVAVKLIHVSLVGDEGFRVRFSREVEASRKVSGAYTAAVVEAAADADVPWLASVFVPGPSLHDAVATAGPLREESALRLAAGLATALMEIHRVGLVHRDLKPSNVLLTDDGLRVIDFGIAKAVDDPGNNLTRAGSMVGSPGFMSPEQIEDGTLGPASDVFSLGAVLAAACTGRSPFTGASTLQTLNNVVSVRTDLSALPPRVLLIVERCLAKDPSRRPTPEQVLDLAHPVPPSVRPWLPAVHRMIDDQRTAVARYLPAGPHSQPPEEQTIRVAVPRPNPTSVFAAGEQSLVGPPPVTQPPVTPPPARRGPRWGLVAVAAAAVVALLAGGAVVWQKWPLSGTASGGPAKSSQSSTPPAPASSSAPTTTAPKPSPTTSAPKPAARKELRLFWNGDLQDNATCPSEDCLGRNRAKYGAVRQEGFVLATREEGTVPLKTFWNEVRGDVATCGTEACAGEQKLAGYGFLRDEGYVYAERRPGTVPLRLFWNAEREDNATCVTDACAEDQTSVGYQYIRDEGFVFPATS